MDIIRRPEKVLAIMCWDCGLVTEWTRKEVRARDKDQTVVYCEHCGNGFDMSKKDMMKAFRMLGR